MCLPPGTFVVEVRLIYRACLKVNAASQRFMNTANIKNQYSINIYQHIIVAGKFKDNRIPVLQRTAAGLYKFGLKGHTDIIIRSFR